MSDYRDRPWPSAHDIHTAALRAGGVTLARTARGRHVDAVRVGTDRRSLFVTAGVHGAERMNPAATARLLAELVDAPELHRDWTGRLRLVLLPLVNPDGYELWRRANDVTWAETVRAGRAEADRDATGGPLGPPDHYYTGPVVFDGVDYRDRPGFDIARDLEHSTRTVTPGGRRRWGYTVESRALLAEFERARAEDPGLLYLDLHCQRDGYRPVDSERTVEWSVVADERDPGAARRARRFAGGIVAGVRGRRGTVVATTYPGFSGAPRPDVPAVLSEVSGLPHEPLSRPIDALVQLGYDVLLSAIHVAAGITEADSGPYDGLPATDR